MGTPKYFAIAIRFLNPGSRSPLSYLRIVSGPKPSNSDSTRLLIPCRSLIERSKSPLKLLYFISTPRSNIIFSKLDDELFHSPSLFFHAFLLPILMKPLHSLRIFVRGKRSELVTVMMAQIYHQTVLLGLLSPAPAENMVPVQWIRSPIAAAQPALTHTFTSCMLQHDITCTTKLQQANILASLCSMATARTACENACSIYSADDAACIFQLSC